MEKSLSIMEKNRFGRRLWGLDPKQVELFIQQMFQEIQSLQGEKAQLRRQLQHVERELQDYRERDKTLRNVLFNAQRAVEQIKANAEKEAKLAVAQAELEAEKILQAAHQRLAQLHEDIHELRRQRTQLETKLRSTIETYRQLLEMDKEDEENVELESKVKFLKR